MQLLIEHSWPGNVRELENAVERAVVLAAEEWCLVDVLPDQVLHPEECRSAGMKGGALTGRRVLFEVVADFERLKILEALEV